MQGAQGYISLEVTLHDIFLTYKNMNSLFHRLLSLTAINYTTSISQRWSYSHPIFSHAEFKMWQKNIQENGQKYKGKKNVEPWASMPPVLSTVTWHQLLIESRCKVLFRTSLNLEFLNFEFWRFIARNWCLVWILVNKISWLSSIFWR